MRKELMLVAAVALLATPPAFGFVAQDEASIENPDLEKMVCKRQSVTGSRVKTRKVCMTRRDWNQLENGTRDGVNDYLKRATSGAPQG